MPLTVSITLTDADLLRLDHDILDPEQWARDMIAGKIAACATRLETEARAVLAADPDVDSVPSDPDALITVYTARPDYKNRKQRDADEEVQRRAAIDTAKTLAEQEATARAAASAEFERSIQERIDAAVAKALEKATKQGSRA